MPDVNLVYDHQESSKSSLGDQVDRIALEWNLSGVVFIPAEDSFELDLLQPTKPKIHVFCSNNRKVIFTTQILSLRSKNGYTRLSVGTVCDRTPSI